MKPIRIGIASGQFLSLPQGVRYWLVQLSRSQLNLNFMIPHYQRFPLLKGSTLLLLYIVLSCEQLHFLIKESDR